MFSLESIDLNFEPGLLQKQFDLGNGPLLFYSDMEHEMSRKSEKIISVLDKIGDGLERCINVINCVLIAVIVLAVVLQVFFREVSFPIVFLGELSTYCVIWLIFLGLSVGYKHGMLAQVDIICNMLPNKAKPMLEIIWDMLAVIIMAMILWSSRLYIAHVFKSATKSPEMKVPLWFVYLGPILGYILTTYFAICKILDKIFKKEM